MSVEAYYLDGTGNEVAITVTEVDGDYEITMPASDIYVIINMESLLNNPLPQEVADAQTNIGSVYTPAYTLIGDFTFTGNEITATYPDQATVDAGAPMNDLARLLGTLFRQTNATVSMITFDGVEYTWDPDNGLIGSNWVDGSGNTLVSTIVAGPPAPGDVLSMTLSNDDGNVYTINFSYSITPPLT